MAIPTRPMLMDGDNLVVRLESDFELANSWGSLVGEVDLSSYVVLPEWKIRERNFLGDLVFRVGSLVMDRMSVPLLDFALASRFELWMLPLRGSGKIGFVDSSNSIELALEGNEVVLWASYVKGRARTPYVDLVGTVATFLRALIDAATREQPALIRHPFIESLYRDSGVREMGQEQFRRHSDQMVKRI